MLFPPPGDLPHPGIEPASLASPALARGFFPSGATREALSTRKEPHKRNELGSRQSMSSSPAAHTTLVPKAFPCGPGLCSSEQKTVSSAWLGPESHGQDRNHPFICKDPLPSPVSFKNTSFPSCHLKVDFLFPPSASFSRSISSHANSCVPTATTRTSVPRAPASLSAAGPLSYTPDSLQVMAT